MNKLYLVVSFFSDKGHTYPNVGRLFKIFKSKREQMYWYSIAVMAASVRKIIGESVEIIVFSNVQPPFDVKKLISLLKVSVENIPYRYMPPPGYCDIFQGSFYVFDVMETLLRRSELTDKFIFIDPDCIWIDKIDPLLRKLEDDGYLNYSIDYPPEYRVNGLSRKDMAILFADLSGNDAFDLPMYFGGEMYGFTATTLKDVVTEINNVWHLSIMRFQKGLAKFNSEEHILNYIFWKKNVHHGNANLFLKRIWTSHTFKNINGHEFSLICWHLPSEKTRGFYKLFKKIKREKSPFWKLNGDDYKHYLGKLLGVEPILGRLIIDKFFQTLHKLRLN